VGTLIYELGREAEDIITGFRGIIIGRCEYLFGCNTIGIAPRTLKDGKRIDTEWFDEGRIRIIGVGINPVEVQGEAPGADYNRDNPKRHINW